MQCFPKEQEIKIMTIFYGRLKSMVGLGLFFIKKIINSSYEQGGVRYKLSTTLPTYNY